MLVYIIGGLIGLFYYKGKYNLSFGSALSYGVTLGFGLYFGFGAITSIFTLVTGVEDVTKSSLMFILFSGLTALCFWILSQAKKRSRTIEKAKSQSNIQPSVVNNSISIPCNKIYALGDEVETKLVGVTFEGRQVLLRNAHVGQKVKIKREPSNSYDPNAMSVNIRDDDFESEDNYENEEDNPYIDIDESPIVEQIIGYINRELAKELAPLFDKQNEEYVFGNISSIYPSKNEPSILGAAIKFQLPGYDYVNEPYRPF